MSATATATEIDPNVFHLEEEPHHEEGSSTMLGFWLYLMSDCLIFAMLFAVFGVLGGNYAAGPGPKELFDLELVAINTAMLLFSSITYGFADNIAVLLAKPEPDLIEPMRLDLAYSASSQIIDAASPFAMDDLCTAAKGLCDLLDAAPRQGGFDWRIATVHAQAMKVLLSLPPEEQAARTAILTNLHEVLRKKLPASDQSAI